ncbi:MAG TPA: ribonuclease E/G [Candidatus Limnocylindria bacterium]|nr:ribonuclease E/G [Candidatus Limnocylindria bacterium]
MTELLLRTRDAKPAAALMKEGRLVEYWDLEYDAGLSSGAILLGKAGRTMKGIGALFVTLPGGKEGFLPFNETRGERLPQAGDPLLVQVKKPPIAAKSAYLTMDVALPGRYCVLLPLGDGAHASARARDHIALKNLAKKLRPDGMGLVLRKNAEDAAREDVEAEIASGAALWAELSTAAKRRSAPALLLEAPGPLEKILRDLADMPERVLADDEKAAAPLGLPVRLHEDPFGLNSVGQQLEQALRRRVHLPSGGNVVLDQCEAALLIDVNSANDTRGEGGAALRVNLEAADEIARLLRLRRAGGIILIDFIDMRDDAQRQRVLGAFRAALRDDRALTEVLGFTRLGLLEMTRKRADSPLAGGAQEDTDA